MRKWIGLVILFWAWAAVQTLRMRTEIGWHGVILVWTGIALSYMVIPVLARFLAVGILPPGETVSRRLVVAQSVLWAVMVFTVLLLSPFIAGLLEEMAIDRARR
jgi:hypothetical protein